MSFPVVDEVTIQCDALRNRNDILDINVLFGCDDLRRQLFSKTLYKTLFCHKSKSETAEDNLFIANMGGAPMKRMMLSLEIKPNYLSSDDFFRKLEDVALRIIKPLILLDGID
ncbi:hypothetical protein GJ496_007808 [Pomphorhynchus laevis]|nr:hypothetical protein GJ496_007808 [Pomphorhynchus laevis]